MSYWGENIYKNIIISKQNVGSQLILLNKVSAGTDVIPSQESVFLHLIIDSMLNINSTVNNSSECPREPSMVVEIWYAYTLLKMGRAVDLNLNLFYLLTKIFISFCFPKIWLLSFVNYRIKNIVWVTNKRKRKREKLSHW